MIGLPRGRPETWSVSLTMESWWAWRSQPSIDYSILVLYDFVDSDLQAVVLARPFKRHRGSHRRDKYSSELDRSSIADNANLLEAVYDRHPS